MTILTSMRVALAACADPVPIAGAPPAKGKASGDVDPRQTVTPFSTDRSALLAWNSFGCDDGGASCAIRSRGANAINIASIRPPVDFPVARAMGAKLGDMRMSNSTSSPRDYRALIAPVATLVYVSVIN